MSDLPAGFVIDSAHPALPDGFQIDGQQQAKKPFGLADTWPARLAKAAWSGLTLPGDVAQGNVSMTGPDGRTNPEVIGRAAELASIASPVSAAAGTGPMVAQAAGLGAGKINPAQLPTREALLAASNQGYDSARNMGVDIASNAVSGIGQRAAQELQEKGISDKLAPKTFSLLNELNQAPADSVATIANLDTIRRAFGHAAKDFANPTEQLAAKSVTRAFDDYLAAIPDQDVVRGPAREASKILSEARGNYAASKRSQQIAEALESADLQAASANSGQNIGNATRQKLKSILSSDKKSAGFNDAEIAAMEQAVRGTAVGNSARTLGNMLGGGGGLGSVVAAAVGGSINPMLAGAPIVGYGLKKASDAALNRQVRQLDEMVRARSPLAQALLEQGYATPQVSAQQEALARALLLGASSQ